MTPKELKQKVWELIDDYCMDMSREEYADLLEDISSDAEIRAEGVRQEIEDANG